MTLLWRIACSATSANCPPISQLELLGILPDGGLCTGTFIESPRSTGSSRATGRSSSSWVRSVIRSQRAISTTHRLLAPGRSVASSKRTASASNNSDPELFQRLLQSPISILAAQQQHLDHGSGPILLASSLLQCLPESLSGRQRPLPHCSSAVEPAKAPGFFVSASR